MALENALPGDEDYRKSGYYALFVERHEIAAQLIKGRSVLDTCCGTGWGTHYYLNDQTLLTVGIDRSYEALRYYELHKNSPPLLQMDALNLGFSNGLFDVVLALESIEHFSPTDAKRYVRELARVMHPEGIVLGTTPLCADRALIPIFKAQNEFHLYAYTREDLHLLLKQYFKAISLLEMYNEVCPYWVFLCARDPNRLHEGDVLQLCKLISQLKTGLKQLKVKHFLKWSQEAEAIGETKSAMKLSARAFIQQPSLQLLERIQRLVLRGVNESITGHIGRA